MASVTKRPLYDIMDGIRYPAMFSPECFKEALEYKAQPEDVFIVTYPKCGTTWMQNIALYIFRKGQELRDIEEFLTLSPFLELLGAEGIEGMARPGSIKTHLPYGRMPYSAAAKYIFVARNPKDCCVSFFNHARNILGFGFWDGEFDDFFELFMAGEVEYDDYFDHLLSWYPHRNDPNVFYTTYEDMKRDTRDVVLKVAAFLGPEYVETIEKDNGVLNSILKFSRFDYMQERLSPVFGAEKNKGDDVSPYKGFRYMSKFTASLNPPRDLPEAKFVRKGIVGDWENYLSPEQTERLNQKFLEKMKGTDVLHWFPR